MANFGWAYVDCTDTGGGGQAAGPTGSVQFLTGANATSGSAYFVFHTASIGEHTPNTLVLSGNLTVTGAISASAIHYQDITHIDATGSTFFGNSTDDIHSRTGSLEIWAGSTPEVAILTASAYSQQTFVRGFGANYTNVTSSHHTASTFEHILGVTATVVAPSNIFITIPSPSDFSAGAILVVKDEVTTPRGLSNITLTRSVTDTYTIDGDASYILTGTMPAISLYSNGSNWFVF
tara:strand:+ start:8815 stop:9519 length:705 start_codon:yes stop_codon:yes gene_type:complete